jgi:hypothetical protein
MATESARYVQRKHLEELGLVAPVAEKRCRKCGITKPRQDFGTNRQLSDGVDSWCRACHAEANRIWRQSQKTG